MFHFHRLLFTSLSSPRGLRSLRGLTQHLTAQAGDNHAPHQHQIDAKEQDTQPHHGYQSKVKVKDDQR